MNKLVSIVVPIYNAEAYLEQCLDSIVNQTYKVLEIILVDDGSKDNSLEICNSYAKIDCRIVVVHKENGGVSSARNIGIEQSKGEYILFIDSDDTVELTYVEELVNANKDGKRDLVICGYNNIFVYKNNFEKCLIYEKLSYDITEDYYKIVNFLKSPYIKLYSARIIRSNKITFPADIRLGEDQVFNQKYLYYVNSYNIVNQPLYNYFHRQHFSLSKSCNSKDFSDAIQRLKIEKKFLKDRNIINYNSILSNHGFAIVAHFTVLDDETIDYGRFENRLKSVQEIVDFEFYDNTFRKRVIYWLINRRAYFLVYLIFLLRVLWIKHK